MTAALCKMERIHLFSRSLSFSQGVRWNGANKCRRSRAVLEPPLARAHDQRADAHKVLPRHRNDRVLLFVLLLLLLLVLCGCGALLRLPQLLREQVVLRLREVDVKAPADRQHRVARVDGAPVQGTAVRTTVIHLTESSQ